MHRLLAAVVVASLGQLAHAQSEDASPPAQPEEVQPEEQAPPQRPDLVQAEPMTVETIQQHFVETPVSELTLRLAPIPLDELEQVAAAAISILRMTSRDVALAMINQQRMEVANGVSDEERAAIDQRLTELHAAKSDLVTRTNLILAAIEAKGGDVASDRAYITVVQNLQPHQQPAAEPSKPAATSEEDAKRAELDAKVADVIGGVRERPPSHERPEPWTVPVDELELELQPLRRDDLINRIEAWLGILQRQVSARIRTDIALTAAEDTDVRQRLADRSAQQQQIISDITKRVQAALLILQKRGGDVSEFKRYVASATGQRLNLTDPAILYAQSMAWLRSPDGGLKIGFSLAKFVGILLLTWLLSHMLGKAARTAVKRIPRASSLLQDFVVGSVKRLILVIGLVIGVYYLGVNVTPLVAAIGAAGLVIGLALQGTLSNFASGLLILVYRPYDVGDVIDGGGVSGKVEAMNLVSTRILTFDNQVMIVPNNSIWNGVITNVTGRKTRRVDLTFGIGYTSDIGKAVEILEATMKSHDKVLADPAPVVRVHSLGDNSVNLIARPWTKTTDYWDVYWDLMRAVKERFDENDINIPFPQRDLHVPGTIEVRLAGDSRGRRSATTVEGKDQPGVAVHEPGVDEDDT